MLKQGYSFEPSITFSYVQQRGNSETKSNPNLDWWLSDPKDSLLCEGLSHYFDRDIWFLLTKCRAPSGSLMSLSSHCIRDNTRKMLCCLSLSTILNLWYLPVSFLKNLQVYDSNCKNITSITHFCWLNISLKGGSKINWLASQNISSSFVHK